MEDGPRPLGSGRYRTVTVCRDHDAPQQAPRSAAPTDDPTTGTEEVEHMEEINVEGLQMLDGPELGPIEGICTITCSWTCSWTSFAE